MVEAHDIKQLTTSLGDVQFKKTLFTNKETGHSEYLLDRILGLSQNERLTEDTEARLLEEAVQTSYRRGGEEVSLGAGVSKQTVKNKLHQLEFPKNAEKPKEKKVVEYLYIDAVYEYIESHYDLEKVKKIYVNSDGGGWIKAEIKRISGAVHVLDGYHLEKYMTKLTSHMKDSKEDAAREYILSNWSAAVRRLKHKDGIVGSSTEGHVSHVLSSIMSSRPMGWSEQGARKMAQLRAYYFNGGDMLELVCYQKKELPKVAGDEYDILSSTQILSSEKIDMVCWENIWILLVIACHCITRKLSISIVIFGIYK